MKIRGPVQEKGDKKMIMPANPISIKGNTAGGAHDRVSVNHVANPAKGNSVNGDASNKK